VNGNREAHEATLKQLYAHLPSAERASRMVDFRAESVEAAAKMAALKRRIVEAGLPVRAFCACRRGTIT
jgi:hypothetical protein